MLRDGLGTVGDEGQDGRSGTGDNRREPLVAEPVDEGDRLRHRGLALLLVQEVLGRPQQVCGVSRQGRDEQGGPAAVGVRMIAKTLPPGANYAKLATRSQ